MRILLLHPGWTGEYGGWSRLARRAGKWPPLNLCYLAAYAEQLGHEVAIIDGEAERISLCRMVDRVKRFCPDLIGMTATTPFYHLACNLAVWIRTAKVSAPIVIGGPHITVLKHEAFHSCFDYGFVGEADTSWPEFLGAVESGQSPNNVRGLLYHHSTGPVFTGPANPCPDLNSVPIPSRHLLRRELYCLGTLRGRLPFTTIMSVRGCPYTCIFCSTQVFGKDCRRRSPDIVVDEMAYCVERFGTRHFMFLDDTLTLNRRHMMEICDRIIDRKLNISFEGSTRANLIDERLIEQMVRAGLIRLSFGLETVDETMRRTMKKMVPLESYIEANDITNRFGVETLNSCMIGLPGETRQTVRKTLAFLRRSRAIKQANISIAVPYPGTELFDMARKGEMGLKLMTEDYSQYRRYNAAVMQVGDLTPADLIRIQNEAFASIYLAPWRWWPMIRKFGFGGAWLTLVRLMRCVMSGRTNYLTNRQLEVK